MERKSENDEMMDIADFRSQFKVEPAKSSRFIVNVIHPPGLSEGRDINAGLMFRAFDASLSGHSLETETFRYYGPYSEIPYQSKVTDLEISFYTDDEEMEELKYFLKWIGYVHGSGTYDFNFPDEYQSTVEIEKLAETGTIALKMQFLRAYPVTVSETPLSWEDDDFIKVKVQMAFTDFKLVEVEHHSSDENHSTESSHE